MRRRDRRAAARATHALATTLGCSPRNCLGYKLFWRPVHGRNGGARVGGGVDRHCALAHTARHLGDGLGEAPRAIGRAWPCERAAGAASVQAPPRTRPIIILGCSPRHICIYVYYKECNTHDAPVGCMRTVRYAH